MTMTNAELAAAIEWAYSKLVLIQAAGCTLPADNRLMCDHFTELLRIQRERAAAQTDVGKVPARLPEWPNGGVERQLKP